MKDIKIPSVGESITEVDISEWKVKSGDFVKRDDVLLTIDSDKASLELAAETSGVVEITVQAGETVKVGTVVGKIDETKTAGAGGASASAPAKTETAKAAVGATSAAAPKASVPASKSVGSEDRFSPAARKMAADQGIGAGDIAGSGRNGMVLKEDILNPRAKAPSAPSTPAGKPEAKIELPKPRNSGVTGERETRTKMPSIRRKIATRLVMAQHTAAILTTFNEIDMGPVMKLRDQYKESFEKKHGVRLGFMSFFTKAVVEALKSFPAVNSYIDGQDFIERHYYDISVAVSGAKGLVVPVIHDADQLSLSDIEKTIKYYASRAKDGTITVEEMSGGGFTISNGGVFGSLMSTPILNPPQTGILGLHKIEDRAVVQNGQIVIRPMMYVALSYDHRVIDGQQSVSFLVRVKEIMEDPTRILLEV